jgi:hypothetical protein
MQNLFSGMERPLPELLQDDLKELLTWENNCVLTWVRLDDEELDSWRRFSVQLWSDGRLFALALDFGIPAWMTQRGVEAVLPAHLAVSEIEPGARAAVNLGLRKWSQVRTDLPRTARTCARLINELWGATRGEDLMLVGIDYLEYQLSTPFSLLPGYG